MDVIRGRNVKSVHMILRVLGVKGMCESGYSENVGRSASVCVCVWEVCVGVGAVLIRRRLRWEMFRCVCVTMW